MHGFRRLVGPGIGGAYDRLRSGGEAEHHPTIHWGDERKRVPISYALPGHSNVNSLAAAQPPRAFVAVKVVLPDAGRIDDYSRVYLPAFAGVPRSRHCSHGLGA